MLECSSSSCWPASDSTNRPNVCRNVRSRALRRQAVSAARRAWADGCSILRRRLSVAARSGGGSLDSASPNPGVSPSSRRAAKCSASIAETSGCSLQYGEPWRTSDPRGGRTLSLAKYLQRVVDRPRRQMAELALHQRAGSVAIRALAEGGTGSRREHEVGAGRVVHHDAHGHSVRPEDCDRLLERRVCREVTRVRAGIADAGECPGQRLEPRRWRLSVLLLLSRTVSHRASHKEGRDSTGNERDEQFHMS